MICENAPLAVWGDEDGHPAGPRPADSAGRGDRGGYLEVNEQTEDFLEGPRSFVEKRKPAWKGTLILQAKREERQRRRSAACDSGAKPSSRTRRSAKRQPSALRT
jgi:hypothetical protein